MVQLQYSRIFTYCGSEHDARVATGWGAAVGSVILYVHCERALDQVVMHHTQLVVADAFPFRNHLWLPTCSPFVRIPMSQIHWVLEGLDVT
jgi:hypothetical protein